MATGSEPGAWSSIWQWLLAVAGALGLAGLLAWLFQETLKQLLPTPRRIARRLRIWRGEVPRAKGTHFTVLIADLDGDADGRQTRHVEAALREHRGLEVVLVGPGRGSFDLGSRAEAQIEAEKWGRALLEGHNGDVLIFGEVAKADTRLRLRFLPGHPAVEGRHASYQLQAAELPADFGADFNAVLLALVAASVAPVTEQAGTYLVELLRPVAGKLRQLLAHPPPGLDSDQRAGLVHSFALAALMLGEQTGEHHWLEEAVEAYRAVLQIWTRKRVPLQWAATQNNLGNALRALGERESGTERLEEAVAAYRAALEEFERVPLQWATTQHNLGNALRALGEREEGTKRLEDAVEAFHAALEVFREAGAAYCIAGTEANLARAGALLAKRRAQSAAERRAQSAAE